ncbi:hypothetical protein [Streptomyces sp. WAC00263]|uniref:hypothetical protein n=1 Tax=Streptomyces sp. WAC00263 TaxID=1917422 RepID=UPI0009CFF6EB|nr:hypothetical protein [Streptomyces sp. WAC00263]KAF5990249.1 hypothetical protein BOG92_054445 [Streptomyces sp. WAC00263]KAF5990620.1 hypothetical protein BOG92_000080 [Streptomyces sp. WAC00263]
MENALTPMERSSYRAYEEHVKSCSYRAYEEHVKSCTECIPGRCAVGEALCRAYLADIRKK